MYRALCALNAGGSANGSTSGAEIAEIAVCIAAGASCPVVLACSAPGARSVAEISQEIGGSGRSLTSATLAAMDALLTRSLNEVAPSSAAAGATGKNARGRNARKKPQANSREDVAIVCAGLLEAGTEAERNYRAAFRFASRHRLPILYIVANRAMPGEGAHDLRSIYPEFGIPLFTVEANDAIASYRVATEALHNARHLRGPSVIEALAVPAHGTGADPLHLLTAYMERHGNPPQPSRGSS